MFDSVQFLCYLTDIIINSVNAVQLFYAYKDQNLFVFGKT